jgi:hypothetical protein
MENRFSIIMADRTDAELIKILTEQRDDYEKEAVIACEKELESRNLNIDEIEIAKEENKKKTEKVNSKANESLSVGLKILTFLIPIVLVIVFAGVFKADGYDRKAKELSMWTIYGLGFYYGLAQLIKLIG